MRREGPSIGSGGGWTRQILDFWPLRGEGVIFCRSKPPHVGLCYEDGVLPPPCTPFSAVAEWDPLGGASNSSITPLLSSHSTPSILQSKKISPFSLPALSLTFNLCSPCRLMDASLYLSGNIHYNF